mmetsp:Transcript_2958/g.13937  ORF Transcript_2958/g.13937 Transcript_2958/m.13937 type:complete len:1132 (-) Transcript_2958:4097-7492(-)|eukprot:CAMPEP_0113962112 /NCGR_PEP_ID=MMETSP0011_2-20120614/5721_1 /TAXON_ID=101924 /ORGANISM="Rhodosorus marinus" /LENGTH=1131 /DNA_ID=CAMNT_0000973903 /DNA_START=328 /DNA_END=3723 /DNA_ORIENTATION=- /assembly_acc=CAM_ASM_000156
MGYFAHGWEKKYRTGGKGDDGGVTWLSKDYQGRWICVVKPFSVSIWSAGIHRVILGFKRFAEELDEGDELVGAGFDDKGGRLLVVSATGRLFSLAVDLFGNGRSFIDWGNYENGAGLEESESVHRLRLDLRKKSSLEEVTVSAVAGSRNGLFLGCSDGTVYLISFDTTVSYQFDLAGLLAEGDNLKKIGAYLHGGNPKEALYMNKKIVNLAFCEARHLLGLVTASGVAVLLTTQLDTIPEPMDGWWLRTELAVSIALNSVRGTIALGLADGDIELHMTGYSPGERSQLLRRLTLSSWYFVPGEVGRVTRMQWSDDGVALAVGWQKQGLVVWSVSGCRLVWTLPQVGSAVASSPTIGRKSSKGEALSDGVKELLWGPFGLSLWAIPQPYEDNILVEYKLVKNASLGNPFQNEATRLVLIGSDKLMMLGLNEDDVEELFEWQDIPFHKDYIQTNWPVQLVAVNSDLTFVAVAGRRGFAVFHMRSGRWRLFGDIKQERSIECCGLAWVGKLVVVCCEEEERPGEYEMLLFRRDFLDEASIVAQTELPSRVECIDVQLDGRILVLCEGGRLFIYKADYDNYKSGEVELTIDLQVSLQESFSKETLSIRLFPPLLENAVEQKEEKSSTEVLLLKRTGLLQLLDLGKLLSFPLLRNIETIWFTSSAEVPFDKQEFRPLIWAYGERGLFASFDLANDAPRKLEADLWFDWDPEVYPLGLTACHGMVLGLTQGLALNDVPVDSPLAFSYHTVKVKRQPVLHRLLKHAVTTHENNNAALELALTCVDLPQFSDSLEWLLYETVKDHDRQDSPGSESRELLFARVVSLLRNFGEYEDIVVRCARKMDAHWWPLLFDYAGEPASLLETCSSMSRLRTAACLLIILQEMFGYATSTPYALKLFQASMESGQLVLAADLANFLRKAREAKMLNVAYVKIPKGEEDLMDEIRALYQGHEDDEPLPIIFSTVNKKAIELLAEMNLRSLGALARAMNLPLSLWITRNRARLGQQENPVKTINLLHEQFSWPFPTGEKVNRKISAFENVRNGHVDRADSGIQKLAGSTYNADSRREVVYLQKAFLKARVYDIALALSMVLLDVEAVFALLVSHPKLKDPFLDTLKSHSDGYENLAVVLRQWLFESQAG